MTDLAGTIVGWADQRITEVLAAPPMWGSTEAVELQLLTLFELRALALRPDQELENPRRVLDLYVAFLRERFPSSPTVPLFKLVEDAEAAEFRGTITAFHERLRHAVLAENPFEHSQLAIQLTFAAGREPTTSAVTGYYEEFRRATRATTRTQAQGRASRDIESATDFTLADMLVTRPNGAPGRVLLRLGAGHGDASTDAQNKVRDALWAIATIAEWAESGESIDRLGIDDVESRTRTAVQALRLVPRRGIEVAAYGGRLLVRSRPIEFRSGHEPRFVEVVGAGATVDHFDVVEEIRALDLDRGHFVLGRKQRIVCHARPEMLGELGEVGIRARVVGRRYLPPIGRSFVLVESIEPMDASPAE